MRAGNNGITADTVKNIQFGAGTVHKGLKYTSGSGWNFEESCVGATKGGSSVKIEPEFYTTVGKKPRRALFRAFESKKNAIIREARRRFKEL